MALIPLALYAQRERNYIYLFDCTKSMKGYGNNENIYSDIKDYLHKEIESQDDNSTICIIPFQHTPYSPIKFHKTDFSSSLWGNIESVLDEKVENVTNTNIYDAWMFAERSIDPHKDNYIFLLTDGIDNVYGELKVCDAINSWCGKYKNSHGFYVMLTDKAKSKAIIEAVNNCEDIDLVDGPILIGHIDQTEIVANSMELPKTFIRSFSSNREINGVKIDVDDELFDVRVKDNIIRNGQIKIEVLKKPGISQNTINKKIKDSEKHLFTAKLITKESNVTITNPKLYFGIINKNERTLTLHNGTDGINMGKSNRYDGFWFCEEKTPDTLHVDLKPDFNNYAQKHGSNATLQIIPENKSKAQFFYDGHKIERNFTISPDDNGILSMVFDNNEATGTHYFNLTIVSHYKLDRINESEKRSLDLQLRAVNDKSVNPLKKVLIAITLAITALLLLWFLIVKPSKYHKFKRKSFFIQGLDRGNNFFKAYSLRNCRKIVITPNKKKKQSALNRIFTGRITYYYDSQWPGELILTPYKKNAIIKFDHRKYSITPSNQIKPLTDYIITTTNESKEYKITIN